MAYFPFFVDIAEKKGLIVGGGAVAARKAHTLLEFGALLTIVAPEIEEELLMHPRMVCLVREFRTEDLDGVEFVIAATSDREQNTRVSALCRERNIPVNVVDDREKCSFLFPSVIKEGLLSVGITTSGASPQTAAALREKVEAVLPSQTEQILDGLAGLRETAKREIADDKRRAAFLKRAAVLALERDRGLTAEETAQLLEEYGGVKAVCGMESACDAKDACGMERACDAGDACGSSEDGRSTVGDISCGKGRVTLVGAGCRSMEYITLKGLKAVSRAQVLVYDDLLDVKLLSYAPADCEKLYVGKRNGAHSMKQESINELLVQKAEEGKYVVRLKGGDPYVFGRGGEEILALREAGIEADEIPGITSAIAVPAAAGIPVTHRGKARSFHVITGHTADSPLGLPDQMEAIAGLEGTCIFLMGLSHLEDIVSALVKYGRKEQTPAAVVHGNFDGTACAVRGNLSNIAERVRNCRELCAPAIIVVGECAEMEL